MSLLAILRGRALAALLLTISAGLAIPAWAGAPAEERTLPNGLRIIVQEDHRAPVVLAQVWYRVGSTYETPGLTGISHVLEHMMFKGTEQIGPGELAKLVGRFGGDQNAFTAAHYTGYYQYYDKSRLALALALEADRMRNLVIDENEFKKEIDVVREERRMRVEDNPVSAAWEKMRAVAFLGTPAGQPVIGWPEDLSNISVAHLRDWYDTWYAPNNAILVIVGDVNSTDAFHLAEHYFAALKQRRVPVVPVPRTPNSPGLREIRLPVATRVPMLAMAWNVPSLGTADGDDAWALAVLAAVLDGGMSARLEKDLVRKRKVAASAGASYNVMDRGDTLLTMSLTPAPGKTLDDLRKAVRETIDALRNKPPTDDELARVKAGVVAGMVYQQDSLSGQASLIGALASLGYDWRLKDQWADNIRKVTANDVQRVARTYLVDDRLTIARIVPAEQGSDSAAH